MKGDLAIRKELHQNLKFRLFRSLVSCKTARGLPPRGLGNGTRETVATREQAGERTRWRRGGECPDRVTFHVIGRRARLGRAESRARPRVHPSRHVHAMCGQTRPARRDGYVRGTVPDDIVTGAIYCANCGTLRPPASRARARARACIIWESRWKIVRTARRPRFVFQSAGRTITRPGPSFYA